MDKPLKVAAPLLALRGFVPLSAPGPPDVGVPPVMASVMEAVLDTVLPNWSCTVTAGCVPQAVPPVPPPGCVVKANLDAAPATSASAPKLVVPSVTPVVADVLEADIVMLPLASGVPAVGRTLMPAQVMLDLVVVSPLPVRVLTVIVMAVAVGVTV